MGTLDDHDMFEVTTLVYSRWASEYDLLKQVKGEKDDGSDPDFELMHKARLENHTKAEAKWKALLDRCTKECPKLL